MDYPTKEEIEVAIKTINDLALFAAMHGCFTTPVPELIKVTQFLKSLE